MNKKHLCSFIMLFMTGVIGFSLLSCDGIYDELGEEDVPKSAGQTFQNLDATEYANWVYLNFKDGTHKTVSYLNTEDVPVEWHVALHRYDCKTNGAKVVETTYADIKTLKADIENGSYQIPEVSVFKTDVEDSINVDMTGMMQGVIKKAATLKNKELSKWMKLDMNSMPPDYHTSDKVYLLWLKDNSFAAVRFTGYANASKNNTKGYISLDYLYPVIFKN